MSDGNTSRVSQRALDSSPNTISGAGDRPLSRHLPYKSPFDWETALGVFRAHQLPHLESVDDRAYERVVKTSLGMGWFRVEHDAEGSFVRLSLWGGADEDLDKIATIVRRMFDLDADPAAIAKVFDGDQYLSAIWARYPGLRVARSWDGFESMVTTILGQLVSVSFGRTLTDELMQTAGAKARHPKTGERIHLFPTAKRLLNADLKAIRTSEARRTAIRSLAKVVQDGTLQWQSVIPPKELRKILLSVPGVGAWTSEYVAMRGFHDDDAFPATDYGLKQELKRHPEVDVNRVRPWRAYAASALWRSFAATKGTPYESVV
jgi:DNA-3-methyladenine glycosylase II